MPTLLSVPLEGSLGLDISKLKIDVCLLLGARSLAAQFDNSTAGLQALRIWCGRHGAQAPRSVLEATGPYGELAAVELHTAGWRVHVANPRRVKDYARSLGRRNKTDRIDAEILAGFGAAHLLPAWQPPAPAQLLLRQLLRRLHDLQTILQAERNRLATASEPLVAESLSRLVRALEKEMKALRAELTAHVRATPTLRADVQRLSQIEGIGTCCAQWLCAELPMHLPNARAAAAWAAVTPRQRQSGSSLHSTAPVGSEGNRHLRRVLFMAAMVARQHNPRLKAFADRLAQNGKSKLQILIAVLHKLIKISFALLKNQSSYPPAHNPLSSH
jgi:transposase